MKEIDLGHKYGDGPCLANCCTQPDRPAEPTYPGVYLTLPEGSDLPDSGEITFKFRVCRETEEKRGSKECKYDLELMSIIAVKADPDSKEDEYENASERIEKAFRGKKRDA